MTRTGLHNTFSRRATNAQRIEHAQLAHELGLLDTDTAEWSNLRITQAITGMQRQLRNRIVDREGLQDETR